MLAGLVAGQTPTGIMVPAYANPCCGGGPAMWQALVTTAADPSVPLHVILNPASGPGTGPAIDPNYVQNFGGGPFGPLLDVRAAGAKVYGYVATGYTNRPLAQAQADVDLYLATGYWRGASVQMDGFFLDEMSNDLANTGYYQSLTSYIHTQLPGALVVGNPGTAATFDSSNGMSGFTIAHYGTSVNVVMAFEAGGGAYRTSYIAPAWPSASRATIAHVVHSDATLADMQQSLTLSQQRGAGFVYVTDDVLPNPYDTLPGYWTDLVVGVAQLNQPATATPYGTGCGIPPLSLSPVTNSNPIINTTALAQVLNVPSMLAFVSFGWSRTAAGSIPLPLALDSFGAPGCHLLQSGEALVLPTTITGLTSATFSFPIPNISGLVGAQIYLQGWAPAPGYNAAGLITSNGLEWVVGSY